MVTFIGNCFQIASNLNSYRDGYSSSLDLLLNVTGFLNSGILITCGLMIKDILHLGKSLTVFEIAFSFAQMTLLFTFPSKVSSWSFEYNNNNWKDSWG